MLPSFGVRWVTFASVGILGCYFLFGLIFWLQAVPVDGNTTGMMVMVPVFATAVAAMGLLVGSVFDCAERATYILAPTSEPFFFLTGTAYPLDQMPRFIAALSYLIPSTAGVHTFVPLNQMHASLARLRSPSLPLQASPSAMPCWRIRASSAFARGSGRPPPRPTRTSKKGNHPVPFVLLVETSGKGLGQAAPQHGQQTRSGFESTASLFVRHRDDRRG